ncbi:hypothetical protein Plav_2715 [Parvibaculum lavamentivorans DS-1]|uniref:Rap1a immunity protein domain-containing protein n=1 Tax=Parvibaculum lavamentivorans (strain DS-1 / DSM 13023 / NCIMB 13966) TaxID=402881 RepID=A7HWP0_PARL1|nr:Rap1a/Tai family immunity protein [Parvibaculum lavamentivorans]ABS64323.1 hypothetical protein Plav_2715 [Parvibaculum lavamentivorans DS-1]
MKKLATLTCGVALAAVMSTSDAYAQRITKGPELVSACQSLIDSGSQDGSPGALCKNFLVDMVKTQEQTLTVGEPFRARRLGPNEDETACFQLPKSLPFTGFAGQVIAYADTNPEMKRAPAYELAARALAQSYPCTEEQLRHEPQEE